MLGFIGRSHLHLIIQFALLLASAYCPRALGQVAASSAQLIVTGNIPKPLSLSLDDLRRQPRSTVKAKNEHQDTNEEVHEGELSRHC